VADLHEVHSLRGLKYLHTLWLEVHTRVRESSLRACVGLGSGFRLLICPQ
jgi:hypothetical protein